MKRQTDPYGKVMKKETKEQNRKNIYEKKICIESLLCLFTFRSKRNHPQQPLLAYVTPYSCYAISEHVVRL